MDPQADRGALLHARRFVKLGRRRPVWPNGLAREDLAPKVTSLLATAGSLVVMAIVAVYFAAQPERYWSGLLLLAPPASRDRAAQLFEAISRILARWLLGQLVVMAAVGLMSGLGLWLLGVRATSS